MVKPSDIIQALEDDDKVLSFKIMDGLPLWFLVRYEVMLAVLNYNNTLNVAQGQNTKKQSLIKTVFFALRKSPLYIKRGKIIFFNSGLTNVKQSDNKFFNRVTDDFFFRLKSDSVLIEDMAFGEMRTPRIHDKVYPHLSLILLSKIFGFFRKRRHESDQSVNALITHICKKLTSNELRFSVEHINQIIRDSIIFFENNNALYGVFFKWKKPKIIFLEDASYGSRSFIVLNAKKLNIPVVELQHGFVNEEHFAYRLGSGIAENDFSRLFYPDYFLAYGEFWKESINIPSRVLSIGNPYLSSQIQNVEQCHAERQILFLSSAVAYAEANEFLLRLKNKADMEGYKILFRPHPVEIGAIESRYRVLIDAGITISDESQLYEDFSSSDVIIGELSTALFEAMAIKGKKKFLFMSSYTQSYFNDKITIPQVTEDTIADIFQNGYSENTSGYFWSDNWEEKFDDFIAKLRFS